MNNSISERRHENQGPNDHSNPVASCFGRIRSQSFGAKHPPEIKEERSLKKGLRILAVAIIAAIAAPCLFANRQFHRPPLRKAKRPSFVWRRSLFRRALWNRTVP